MIEPWCSSNPYADYATPVSGPRFIGRETELRVIRSRAFGEQGFGSLAIVGLPRIGKSSLVEEAVHQEVRNLERLRAVVARVELGSVLSTQELFVSMVQLLLGEIRLRGFSTSIIEARAESVFNDSTGFMPVRDFFEAVRENGVRPICILDEFDAGRYLFAETPQCFHWLRELAQAPRFKAVLVLVAKRALGDIARIAGHESDYWSNVLHTIRLKGFRPQECELFYQQLSANGLTLNRSAWREVVDVCGGVPYLLSALAFHVFARGATVENDVSSIVREQMPDVLWSYFRQVRTILEDGSGLRTAVQLFAGPRHDLSAGSIRHLTDYGVIERQADGQLRAFTNSFEDYLRLIEQNVDIWPLWRETERALREALNTLFTRAFGPAWQEKLVKRYPNTEPLIKAAEAKMRHEEQRFARRASDNPLAYTYPSELFQLMAADWQRFGATIFGGTKASWAQKFELLARVRTPLAHNREEVLSAVESRDAEQICGEVLRLLSNAGFYSEAAGVFAPRLGT